MAYSQELSPNSPCPELHCWLVSISSPPANSQQQHCQGFCTCFCLFCVERHSSSDPSKYPVQKLKHCGQKNTQIRVSWKNPVSVIVNSWFSSLYAISCMHFTISDFWALDQLRVEWMDSCLKMIEKSGRSCTERSMLRVFQHVNQTKNTMTPTRVPDTWATQTEGNNEEQGTLAIFWCRCSLS